MSMQHSSTATTVRPDSRLPRSLIVVILQALVVALFFHPIPVASAETVRSGVSNPDDAWIAPVQGATEADLLATFIPPEMPWSAAHRGIDIAAQALDIVAPADGEVTFVGVVVDRPVVSIRHPNGLLSSFEPVESELMVGDTVTQGQVLGTLAAAVSHCDSQCVHWGVRKPDAWQVGSTTRDLYIDPAFLLGWSEPSILWPIHSDPNV